MSVANGGRASAQPPAPVVLLLVAQVFAAGAALWEVVQGLGVWTRKDGIRVPDLVPANASLRVALLLAVGYCAATWALQTRRRAGWWLAAALAVYGIASYAAHGRGWYLHAVVLALAALPVTRHHLGA